MNIAFTGGRDFRDKQLVYSVLTPIRGCILVGDCPTGLDSFVREYCRIYLPVGSFSIFKADWERQGRAAGPRRNRAMLFEGKADLLIAFPGGRGTEDCVKQAKELGIPVLRVEV